MSLPTVRLPPRRIRRIAFPIVLCGLLGVWGLSGVGLVAGVVVLPATRKGVRVAAFLFGYCVVQVAVLALAALLWLRYPRVAGRSVGSEEVWDRWNHWLLTLGVGWVLGLARRCFGYRIEVVGTPTALEKPAPVLVLARHAGPGDTYSLAYLLLHSYQRRVRIVLKEILQLDPALDVMLNRIGACFLPPGSGHELAPRLAELAAGAGDGDAILVFPEGGNWTPDRRRRAIAHLRRNGKHEAADAAERMAHLLPPRPAGALACLDARPDLAVTVMAHAGLDKLIGVRQWWRAIPLRMPMTVQAMDAAPAPATEAGRLDWLTAEWALLDTWVERYHARRAVSAAST